MASLVYDADSNRTRATVSRLFAIGGLFLDAFGIRWLVDSPRWFIKAKYASDALELVIKEFGGEIAAGWGHATLEHVRFNDSPAEQIRQQSLSGNRSQRVLYVVEAEDLAIVRGGPKDNMDIRAYLPMTTNVRGVVQDLSFRFVQYR